MKFEDESPVGFDLGCFRVMDLVLDHSSGLVHHDVLRFHACLYSARAPTLPLLAVLPASWPPASLSSATS